MAKLPSSHPSLSTFGTSPTPQRGKRAHPHLWAAVGHEIHARSGGQSHGVRAQGGGDDPVGRAQGVHRGAQGVHGRRQRPRGTGGGLEVAVGPLHGIRCGKARGQAHRRGAGVHGGICREKQRGEARSQSVTAISCPAALQMPAQPQNQPQNQPANCAVRGKEQNVGWSTATKFIGRIMLITKYSCSTLVPQQTWWKAPLPACLGLVFSELLPEAPFLSSQASSRDSTLLKP